MAAIKESTHSNYPYRAKKYDPHSKQRNLDGTVIKGKQKWIYDKTDSCIQAIDQAKNKKDKHEVPVIHQDLAVVPHSLRD